MAKQRGSKERDKAAEQNKDTKRDLERAQALQPLRDLDWRPMYLFYALGELGSKNKINDYLGKENNLQEIYATFSTKFPHPVLRENGDITEYGWVVHSQIKQIIEAFADYKAFADHPEIKQWPDATIGVTLSFPKHLVKELVHKLLGDPHNYCLRFRTNSSTYLLNALDQGDVHYILAASGVPDDHKNKTLRSEPLGLSDIILMAPVKVVDGYRQNFPKNLHGKPMVLPEPETNLRSAVDTWLDELAMNNIRPRIIGDYDDRSLMRMMARKTDALFATYEVVYRPLRDHHGSIDIVERINKPQTFKLITSKQRFDNPIARWIRERAADLVRINRLGAVTPIDTISKKKPTDSSKPRR